eukprot:12779144-Ditylum_brightwellii.AAC.2
MAELQPREQGEHKRHTVTARHANAGERAANAHCAIAGVAVEPEGGGHNSILPPRPEPGTGSHISRFGGSCSCTTNRKDGDRGKFRLGKGRRGEHRGGWKWSLDLTA